MWTAGCASPPAEAEDATTDPGVLVGNCPLMYPDGEPASCDVQDLVEATTNERPNTLDGWKCTGQWIGQDVLLEQYIKADGHLGIYWEWQRGKEDGVAFQRLADYTDYEQGDSHHIPYQPQGFYAMPDPLDPDGPIEIQETVHLLRVHAKIDGQWVQDPDNVTTLLDNIGGDWWFATRFDWPGGPYFVDTMHEDVEEGQLGKWAGSGWRGTIAGTPVIIDAIAQGVKHTQVDYTMRGASVDACALPAM